MTYYGRRGYTLENIIENVNQEYKRRNIAIIDKVPTPVKVLKVKGNRITSGFYEKKSTVDYIGVFKGNAIAFDAKETSIGTRFDLSNIKEHQYNFLKSWVFAGGIGFLLISFTSLEEEYYLPFYILDEYWKNSFEGGRKSIPYKVIAKDEYKIKQGVKGRRGIYLDYLQVVEDNFKEIIEEAS